MLKTSALAILSVLLSTGGQLILKTGMERIGYIGATRLSRPVELLLQVARSPQIVMALSIFVVAAAVWLIVLSRAPLSFAYPFAGLTYVLITLFARYALHEHVPGTRWVGVLLILLGIVMVGRTSPPGLD